MGDRIPVKHGLLIKRSVAKSRTTIKARFQTRYFKLFEDELTYWTADGKDQKGTIAIDRMRACERLDKETFNRAFMFQIVYMTKSDKIRVLYMQGTCFPDTRSWAQEIKKRIDLIVGNDQFDHYHRGAYLKKAWTCCRKPAKYGGGCCGIPESNESRTRRLSRDISTFNGRTESGSSGTSRHSSDDSWKVLFTRGQGYEGLFSEDEYSDED